MTILPAPDPPALPPAWPDERVERLRDLWALGIPTPRIADELGISKNGVCGKARRLALPMRRKGGAWLVPREPRAKMVPPLRVFERPRGVDAATHYRLAAKVEAMRHRPPRPEIPTSADAPLSTSEPCRLFDLTARSCRWPLGEPKTAAFRFCGAAKPPGEEPYCTSHADFAHAHLEKMGAE